jgi:hypothetical protein
VEDLGLVDLDALIAYVQALPGHVVKADPAVRIVPIEKP